MASWLLMRCRRETGGDQMRSVQPSQRGEEVSCLWTSRLRLVQLHRFLWAFASEAHSAKIVASGTDLFTFPDEEDTYTIWSPIPQSIPAAPMLGVTATPQNLLTILTCSSAVNVTR